jgi:hypothetical protein
MCLQRCLRAGFVSMLVLSGGAALPDKWDPAMRNGTELADAAWFDLGAAPARIVTNSNDPAFLPPSCQGKMAGDALAACTKSLANLINFRWYIYAFSATQSDLSDFAAPVQNQPSCDYAPKKEEHKPFIDTHTHNDTQPYSDILTQLRCLADGKEDGPSHGFSVETHLAAARVTAGQVRVLLKQSDVTALLRQMAADRALANSMIMARTSTGNGYANIAAAAVDLYALTDAGRYAHAVAAMAQAAAARSISTAVPKLDADGALPATPPADCALPWQIAADLAGAATLRDTGDFAQAEQAAAGVASRADAAAIAAENNCQTVESRIAAELKATDSDRWAKLATLLLGGGTTQP